MQDTTDTDFNFLNTSLYDFNVVTTWKLNTSCYELWVSWCQFHFLERLHQTIMLFIFLRTIKVITPIFNARLLHTGKRLNNHSFLYILIIIIFIAIVFLCTTSSSTQVLSMFGIVASCELRYGKRNDLISFFTLFLLFAVIITWISLLIFICVICWFDMFYLRWRVSSFYDTINHDKSRRHVKMWFN